MAMFPESMIEEFDSCSIFSSARSEVSAPIDGYQIAFKNPPKKPTNIKIR
jgi:hypothetical protein